MQETSHLRNFILSHVNWEEILTNPPYSLKISRDGDYILFKYNQLESDFTLPEVQEARGIIFYEPTFACVCRAFDKFGNYGENYCPEIDWPTASVQEKIDGSLMKIWHHNGWHLSTNGTIDAWKAETGNALFPTFGDLFEKALADMHIYHGSFDSLVCDLNTNYTFMFELVSPVNRVVIPYDYFGLYYLGCRNMSTMLEVCEPEAYEDFYVPKRYELRSLADVQNAASALPWDAEGYVVCDANFNRVKIKSPEYVKAHYARNNNVISNKVLLDVVLRGEQSEFLVYASDYKDSLEYIEKQTEEYIKCGTAVEDNLRLLSDRRAFAEYVKKEIPKEYSNFAFKKYENPSMTFKEYVSGWDANKWERILLK